jgi:hypothetical protein
MKLPGGDKAIIEIAKLRDYCLNPDHLRGRHKARVFHSVLGFIAADAEELQQRLADAARNEDAVPGTSDIFGARYIIDSELWRNGRAAIIRSIWIVRNGEDVARLVTCFIL